MRSCLALCLFALAGMACEPEPVAATEADEPTIWATALAHERQEDPSTTPFLLDETIDANTTPFEGASLAAQVPDLDASTLASFEARAHDTAPLAVNVPDGYTFVGVDDTPIATPDAPVISLSRAGLGPDEALLYIEVVCGNACGSGRLFALERDDGEWSVTTTIDLFAI